MNYVRNNSSSRARQGFAYVGTFNAYGHMIREYGEVMIHNPLDTRWCLIKVDSMGMTRYAAIPMKVQARHAWIADITE